MTLNFVASYYLDKFEVFRASSLGASLPPDLISQIRESVKQSDQAVIDIAFNVYSNLEAMVNHSYLDLDKIETLDQIHDRSSAQIVMLAILMAIDYYTRYEGGRYYGIVTLMEIIEKHNAADALEYLHSKPNLQRKLIEDILDLMYEEGLSDYKNMNPSSREHAEWRERAVKLIDPTARFETIWKDGEPDLVVIRREGEIVRSGSY